MAGDKSDQTREKRPIECYIDTERTRSKIIEIGEDAEVGNGKRRSLSHCSPSP